MLRYHHIRPRQGRAISDAVSVLDLIVLAIALRASRQSPSAAIPGFGDARLRNA